MASQHCYENEFASIAYRTLAREKISCEDWEAAQWYLKRALLIAENRFGRLHGEAGMILIELSNLYELWGRPLEKLRVDKQIDDIVRTYVLADAS